MSVFTDILVGHDLDWLGCLKLREQLCSGALPKITALAGDDWGWTHQDGTSGESSDFGTGGGALLSALESGVDIRIYRRTAILYLQTRWPTSGGAPEHLNATAVTFAEHLKSPCVVVAREQLVSAAVKAAARLGGSIQELCAIFRAEHGQGADRLACVGVNGMAPQYVLLQISQQRV